MHRRALLVVALFLCAPLTARAACDTTTTTTHPPVCGNGIVEGNEQCDGQIYCCQGESYCNPCQFRVYGCCEVPLSGGGTCSAEVPAEPGIPPCGGTYYVGRDPASGPPCPENQGGFSYVEGSCGAVATFPPTTFCCKLNGCFDATVSDSESLVNWLDNVCGVGAPHPAIIGTCQVTGPPLTYKCVPPG